MNKKAFIILAAVLIVLVIGLEFYLHRGLRKGPQFNTETVAKGDITAAVITSGTLAPVTKVDVGSQISGPITKINVDFNSHVRKGEALAEIDPAPFKDSVEMAAANLKAAQAAVEVAQNTADEAKKEYDRSLDLFNNKMISSEDKEAAELTYLSAKDDLLTKQAEAREAKDALDASRVNLANTVIRSPIDGVVLSRNVSVGQTVAASMQAPVLFTLANDVTSLMIDCDVDEMDVSQVRVGQNVSFTVTSYPDTPFSGRVVQVRIGSDLTQNVVTYTTLVEVDNTQVKLLPGMTATVNIITAEAKNVLRVRPSALAFEPSLAQIAAAKPAKKTAAKTKRGPAKPGDDVWVLKNDGSIAPVSVHTGITDRTYTEIVSGDLKDGDVVIDGLSYAKK
jgi:HlyD family secretion protein